jgi:hypothetical protein
MKVVLTPRLKIEMFKRYLEAKEIPYKAHKMADGLEEIEVQDIYETDVKSYLKDLRPPPRL